MLYCTSGFFFVCIDVYLYIYTMTEGIQQSTTNDSPVWVPDSDAKTCMHCRKSEFTVVNRRVSLKPGFDTHINYVVCFPVDL